jgi:ABC-type nitrate/sulfonate/bicarbonate transport system permease component
MMAISGGLRAVAKTLASRLVFVRLCIIDWLLGLWQLGTMVGVLDVNFTSSPAKVAGELPGVLSSRPILDALGDTLVQILIAFVLGCASGVIVGILLGVSATLRDAYLPVILFMVSAPKSIFLPLFLLAFGFGDEAIIGFGVFSAFFYVVVNVISGVELVEQRHLTVARAFRANYLQTFADVLFPVALPGIVTGLWHGARHAIGGVLIAQIFLGVIGVGGMLKTFADALQTDSVVTLALVVAFLSVLIGSFWSRLETRLSKWRGARDAMIQPAVGAT